MTELDSNKAKPVAEHLTCPIISRVNHVRLTQTKRGSYHSVHATVQSSAHNNIPGSHEAVLTPVPTGRFSAGEKPGRKTNLQTAGTEKGVFLGCPGVMMSVLL